MTLTDSIKAMPTIADEHGDPCVSQAAVLALIEAKAEEWEEKGEEKSSCPSCSLEQSAYRACAAELSAERGKEEG